jgi:hypothetical protein
MSVAPITLEQFKWDESTTLRDWTRWAMRFESMLQIAKVKYKEQNNTLSIDYLLQVCGDKILDLYDALPNKDTIDWITLKPLIAARFTEPNLRFNTLLLRTAKQGATEDLEDFVTRARLLATNAGISNDEMETELLKVIPAGAYTSATANKALAVDSIKALLEWHKSQTLTNKLEQHMETEASNGKAAVNRMQPQHTQKRRKPGKCYNCGGEYPHTNPCPARGKTCHKCNKLNHFEKQCRLNKSNNKDCPTDRYQDNKRLHKNDRGHREKKSHKAYKLTDMDEREELEELRARFATESSRRMKQDESSSSSTSASTSSSNSPSTTYKYKAYAISGGDASPKANIVVNGLPVLHIVDTGATMNIMVQSDFNKLPRRPRLYPSKARIFAFGATKPTRTLGEFATTINYNRKEIMVSYVVIDDSKGKMENLLSHQASKALEIVKINLTEADHSINRTTTQATLKSSARQQWRQNLFERYKRLFEPRVGKLKGVKVHIDTDPSIKPTQQPPYKIPFHLIPPTKAKLDEMVQNKIIERASGRCTWIRS